MWPNVIVAGLEKVISPKSLKTILFRVCVVLSHFSILGLELGHFCKDRLALLTALPLALQGHRGVTWSTARAQS